MPPQSSRAPSVSFCQPSEKLDKLREAVDKDDTTRLRKCIESKSALNFVGEELDQAGHHLWMLEARPEALRDLKKAVVGKNIRELQMAMEAAAVVLVEESELEAATRRLRDLKARTWRYVPTECHMDLRREPKVNGERVRQQLNPGDIFLVSKEKRGSDGITYLRLEDGRGWAFDAKPGIGVMCERAYEDEEEQWAMQSQHPLGKTVADLRSQTQQKSCLKKSTRGLGGNIGDCPGTYEIVEDTGVTPTVELCSERDLISKLQAGTLVEVLQVVPRPDLHRTRGLISNPAGWISLVDTRSGMRWAKKQAY